MTKNEKATRWMLAVCGAFAAAVGAGVMVVRIGDGVSIATLAVAVIATALVFSLGPEPD
jgi:hypothetical protein